jgi:predicted nucleic acid-binding protein
MILVDTGFLVALAQRRDALHERARAWAAAVDEPLLVTEYVLLETINQLSGPADRMRAHLIAGQVRSSPAYEFMPAQREIFEGGLALHRARPDKGWSLTDCCSFYVMQLREIRRALAHDEHFEQAAFEALIRRGPPK